MTKVLFTALLCTSVTSYAIEQTICYSQYDTGRQVMGKPFYMASVGDDAILNDGKCQGVTLHEMNKKGWRLIQVVTGLESSFGMVFEKIEK